MRSWSGGLWLLGFSDVGRFMSNRVKHELTSDESGLRQRTRDSATTLTDWPAGWGSLIRGLPVANDGRYSPSVNGTCRSRCRVEPVRRNVDCLLVAAGDS